MKFLRSARRPGAILPLSASDEQVRSLASGAIMPMEQPGLFERFFSRP